MESNEEALNKVFFLKKKRERGKVGGGGKPNIKTKMKKKEEKADIG